MSRRSSRGDDVTMQSEIFVTIMVVVVILFIVSVVHKITAINALNEIKKKEQPPLIILDEKTKDYTFKTGSGELSFRFESAIKDKIIPYLEKVSVEYDCDVIEVYGYTDGQAYRKRQSSNSQMDGALLSRLENHEFPNLSATSNLELGMLRAASIVHVLKEYQSQDDTHLSKIRIIRPYSGGQLILEDGTIASASDNKPNKKRRRIELRLSRSRDLHKGL
jgi:hypothetical protein